MGYLITTTTPATKRSPGASELWTDVTRREVDTWQDVLFAMRDPRARVKAMSLPSAEGGTITLADGTVIEVRPT